jgi:hypothetical protein
MPFTNRKSLGSDDPAIIYRMVAIAVEWANLNLLADAEKMAGDATALARKFLEPNHPT